MIESMTGFGGDVFSNDNYTLVTEVKSLNSRFLDLSVRLPKELYPYEFTIRDLVKSKIGRGKVILSIELNPIATSSANNMIYLEGLIDTVELLNRISVESNINEKTNINHLLTFKDNFITQAQTEFEIGEDIVKATVNNALGNLKQMKKAEGAELKNDFDLRINKITELLNNIEKMTVNATDEYFEKFKEKAKKLTVEFIDDKDRFLLELGILSEKHDVTEECTRLRSHIKLFENTTNTSSDAGRKLNFICQEMNREVNTINSKSISSDISHLGIDIKEELEKIREQVQNIE